MMMVMVACRSNGDSDADDGNKEAEDGDGWCHATIVLGVGETACHNTLGGTQQLYRGRVTVVVKVVLQ